jgi:hypothetical protein
MVSHVYVLVWNILAQLVGGNTGLRAARLGAAKTAAAHVCTVQSRPRDYTTYSCRDAVSGSKQMEPRQWASDAADVTQVQQHGGCASCSDLQPSNASLMHQRPLRPPASRSRPESIVAQPRRIHTSR